MLQLTKQEMLALWLRLTRLEPLRADCAAQRTDGVDLAAVAEDEMRRWYLDRLDHAPLEHLRLTDIAPQLPVLRNSRGVVRVKLPADCRRVVSAWLSGWHRPAVPVAVADATVMRRLWASPFGQPGPEEPVCFLSDGGHTLECFTSPDRPDVPTMSSLLVVADPGPDLYVIDQAELSTIPSRL